MVQPGKGVGTGENQRYREGSTKTQAYREIEI